jgi:hypothetical protein
LQQGVFTEETRVQSQAKGWIFISLVEYNYLWNDQIREDEMDMIFRKNRENTNAYRPFMWNANRKETSRKNKAS